MAQLPYRKTGSLKRMSEDHQLSHREFHALHSFKGDHVVSAAIADAKTFLLSASLSRGSSLRCKRCCEASIEILGLEPMLAPGVGPTILPFGWRNSKCDFLRCFGEKDGKSSFTYCHCRRQSL